MVDLTPGIQMRDRLLLDEWTPHIEPEYPGDADTVRFGFFKIFDQAYDLMVDDGMDPNEAETTVKVIFGSGS